MPKVVCEDGKEQSFPYTEQGLASAAAAVGPGCRLVLPGDVQLCPCQPEQAPPPEPGPEAAAGPLPQVPPGAGAPSEVPLPVGGEVMLPPDMV